MYNSYVRNILGGRGFNPLFSADLGGGGGTDPATPETPPADPETPPAEPEAPTKTFTQDDVNAIAAKEAKKAQEKFLKQLGVTDFKTAKEGLEKYNQMIDSQKSDAQKALERAQELESKVNTYETENKTLNAKIAAFSAKVKADSVDDVIVLANNLVNDDTDINAAIVKVLEKYPHFKEDGLTTKEPEKPTFTQGTHENLEKPSEQDTWTQAFSWGLPQK